MKKYADLDIRMKGYEYITRTHLMRRTPVIIRIDGKTFHTFTRDFERPFDEVFMEAMQDTMRYLCENIQGCVLGYTQSDEITLVLVDYQTLNTSAWFDYNIQKVTSVAASMATMWFNQAFSARVDCFIYDPKKGIMELSSEEYHHATAMTSVYHEAVQRGACFDARAFNIPKEEVTNCILWRQNDATRNSILSVGQAYFTHSELHGKSCKEIQNMLLTQKDVNWNDYPDECKRGTCCIKKEDGWIVDKHIPIFKGDGREYIESKINFPD